MTDARNAALGRVRSEVIKLLETLGLEDRLTDDERALWWSGGAGISVALRLDAHQITGAAIGVSTEDGVREIFQFKPKAH
jgi:hypothetical protein